LSPNYSFRARVVPLAAPVVPLEARMTYGVWAREVG
jgi:hypothetical protein